MNKYQKINVITGWVTFLISLIIYTYTAEPTASYWDCGEFIAASYKLEVPHPPGAPLFLLIGRIFSLFAGDNVENVAFSVNMVSVLSSAFTILFLFWTITHLAKKIFKTEEGKETLAETITIMGAGVVGAFTCLSTDSFWFSAVEAEVYAFSSFFTAFVFWAILKWEMIEDESKQNKWVILIAYMMGLSIGVHLLNLVTLPALGLVVYYKYSKEITKKGILITLVLSGAMIIFVMNGVITGFASIVGNMEIFLVNNIGLPFGSGVVTFLIILIGSIIYGIIYSYKKEKVILNTALYGIVFILIGYMSYALVLIRSNYDTPIDENNPEDIMNYVAYLKREQYGSRPLFHGQYFTAEITNQKKGAPVYKKGAEKYDIQDYKVEYEYDPKHTTIFPRMYSSDPNHIAIYKNITGLKDGQKPSFVDNIYFFLRHQLGTFYFRYFMWNFSGRESDIQDASWVGLFDSFKEVPEEIEDNKGRNIYYSIPLLLGLIGIFFQYNKDKRYFWVTAMLFFLTGIAVILYLNSPPTEPRERDYIYVGSYYAFAIWIGLSVLALYDYLQRILKNKTAIAIIASVVCIVSPGIMLAENWDDHNRHNRYFSTESAKNYLDSCAPNSVLFTGGDNDTFPLWFVQEVLGYRTDVRVIVLSYFNTDWYIEQMMRDAYDSKALPFGLPIERYAQGGLNDYLPYIQSRAINGPINAKGFLTLINNEDPRLKVPTSISAYNLLPSKQMFMSVNVGKIGDLSDYYGGTDDRFTSIETDKIEWTVKGNGLEKKDLAIIDLIVNNNFQRPIYFNNTSLNGIGIDLRKHVIQEGLTYRLAPVRNPNNDFLVNTEVMYDNIMNRFHWQGFNDPDNYNNEDYRSFCLNHRSVFNTLAENLIIEGDTARAKKALYKSLEVMPDEALPYDIFSIFQVGLFLELNEKETAIKMANKISDRLDNWLTVVSQNDLQLAGHSFEQKLYSLNELVRIFKAKNENEIAAKYETIFNKHLQNRR